MRILFKLKGDCKNGASKRARIRIAPKEDVLSASTRLLLMARRIIVHVNAVCTKRR